MSEVWYLRSFNDGSLYTGTLPNGRSFYLVVNNKGKILPVKTQWLIDYKNKIVGMSIENGIVKATNDWVNPSKDKMADTQKRIIEVYNIALREQKCHLELGTSKSDGIMRYAIYETLKGGQRKRTLVTSGPDVMSLFFEIANQYNVNVDMLKYRTEYLWNNIFWGL